MEWIDMMKQSGDVQRKEIKVVAKKKALYGLRRAPRLWQKKFTARLIELGLRQISEEPCFFVNDFIFLLFFTDDTITLSRIENRERTLAFKKSLMESFDIKDLGELKWFLGVRVLRDRPNRKLWLCQDSYIETIANRFNLQPMKAPTTPMVTDLLLYYDKSSNKIFSHVTESSVLALTN